MLVVLVVVAAAVDIVVDVVDDWAVTVEVLEVVLVVAYPTPTTAAPAASAPLTFDMESPPDLCKIYVHSITPEAITNSSMIDSITRRHLLDSDNFTILSRAAKLNYYVDNRPCISYCIGPREANPRLHHHER